MSKKVEVTVKQSLALERLRAYSEPLRVFISQPGQYNDLADMTLDEVARAIHNGVELVKEPKFKEGDWVTILDGELKSTEKRTGKVTSVHNDTQGNHTVRVYGMGWVSEDYLRYATQGEVLYQKRKAWWETIGREMNEVHRGDIVLLKPVGKASIPYYIYEVDARTSFGDGLISVEDAVNACEKGRLTNLYTVGSRLEYPVGEWEWDN